MDKLLRDALHTLKQYGWSPRKVLDIGAFHGQWSRDVSSLFPFAQFHLIEAIDYPELARSGFTHTIAVVADRVGEVDWFEGRNTGDSLFKEQTGYYAGVTATKREATTLDTLVAERQLSAQYDFVKIDCQGGELPILRGGERLIDEIGRAHV